MLTLLRAFAIRFVTAITPRRYYFHCHAALIRRFIAITPMADAACLRCCHDAAATPMLPACCRFCWRHARAVYCRDYAMRCFLRASAPCRARCHALAMLIAFCRAKRIIISLYATMMPTHMIRQRRFVLSCFRHHAVILSPPCR